MGTLAETGLKIEMWPIARLKPYEGNPRKIGDKAISKVADSIQRFGFRQPIVVDPFDVIVIGHNRRLAAMKLGLEFVPVHVADLPPDQVKALRLADNRSGEESAWDMKLLGAELSGLQSSGFDLAGTGFDGPEIDRLLTGSTSTGSHSDDDTIPPAPATPVTRAGDVWLLGKHRLVCGDSRKPGDAATAARGQRARLVFTSPPYLQQRAYKGNASGSWLDMMAGVFGDHMPVSDDVQLLVNLGLVHKEGEFVPYWEAWLEAMARAKWRRFGWYVWDQGPGLPGDWNGRLAPAHEFVFHLNRKSVKVRKTKECKYAGQINHGKGLRKPDGKVDAFTHAGTPTQKTKIPDSVFRVMRHKARGIEVSHPAVFPVELALEVITAFTDRGEHVYEPFCGSGTLIVACERAGRVAIAIESEPVYCDVAVLRWQQIKKRAATLEASGMTFDQCCADRLGTAGASLEVENATRTEA